MKYSISCIAKLGHYYVALWRYRVIGKSMRAGIGRVLNPIFTEFLSCANIMSRDDLFYVIEPDVLTDMP